MQKKYIAILTLLFALSLPAFGQTTSVTCSGSGGTNCTGLIPDGFGSLTSTITVSSATCSSNVNNLAVPVNVNHDWVGDLRLTLTHNDTGTSVQLLLPSSCSGDDIDATFSDTGSAPSCPLTTPAISGNVSPVSPLAAFNGEAVAGTWTLTVEDTAVGSNGALNDWGLNFTCVTVPVVSVAATDPTATENSGDTGTFTFTRTGPTTAPLTVFYTVSGTATNGVDYQTLNGMVTIPAGSSSATVTVNALGDPVAEPTETVVVTTTANANYVIGTPASGTVSIIDGPAVVTAIDTPTMSGFGLLLMSALLALLGLAMARSGR